MQRKEFALDLPPTRRALAIQLILDEDGVYDPRHPNDRLLLGMIRHGAARANIPSRCQRGHRSSWLTADSRTRDRPIRRGNVVSQRTMGVGCPHAARSRANPHSARRSRRHRCHFPRFRSLKAFGRRPRVRRDIAIGRHPKPSTNPAVSTCNKSVRSVAPKPKRHFSRSTKDRTTVSRPGDESP